MSQIKRKKATQLMGSDDNLIYAPDIPLRVEVVVAQVRQNRINTIPRPNALEVLRRTGESQPARGQSPLDRSGEAGVQPPCRAQDDRDRPSPVADLHEVIEQLVGGQVAA
jgi:hypothetical protein